MKHTISAIAFSLLTMVAAVGAQTRTHLAYSNQKDSCVFLGFYERGRFVTAPQLSSNDPQRYPSAAHAMLEAFPLHRPLPGINREGRHLRAMVDGVNPNPESGEFSITVTLQSGPLDSDVLFGTGELSIKILPRRSAALTPRADLQLRNRARELWLTHLPERAANERPSSFTLGKPTVERLDAAPGFLTVLFPVDMVAGEEHDNRGSFFFIYSETDHRVVFGKFGHPEWALGSTVLSVKPELFFQVGDNPDVFFVGASQGGWEEWGHAIFDLRRGRQLLFCY